MSSANQASRSRRRKRSGSSSSATGNFWRYRGGPVEPITPADDPTALLRSLGPAPLSTPLADFYIASVIDRAASLAAALAASADLLAATGAAAEPSNPGRDPVL